jgi:hypothetical protein
VTLNLSRRSFLRGSLAAGAVLAIAPALSAPEEVYLTVHGDGERDDTEALNAYLSGLPVYLGGQLVRPDGNPPLLVGGTYRMSAPVVVRIEGTHVSNNTFLFDYLGEEESWLRINVKPLADKPTWITGNTIDTGRIPGRARLITSLARRTPT